LAIASSPGLRSTVAFSVSGARARDPPRRAAVSSRAVREESQQWGHAGNDGGEDLGEALDRTRQLVECAMFAAVAGLAYFLSNSLAIEVCFLPSAHCLSILLIYFWECWYLPLQRVKFNVFFFADAELFQLLFSIADSHLLLKMGTRSRQENCGKSNYIVHLIYSFAKFI